MCCCHVVSKQGNQAGVGNWHAFHLSHTQCIFLCFKRLYLLLELASLVFQHFGKLDRLTHVYSLLSMIDSVFAFSCQHERERVALFVQPLASCTVTPLLVNHAMIELRAM